VGYIEESSSIPVGCKEEKFDFDLDPPKRSRSPDLGSEAITYLKESDYGQMATYSGKRLTMGVCKYVSRNSD